MKKVLLLFSILNTAVDELGTSACRFPPPPQEPPFRFSVYGAASRCSALPAIDAVPLEVRLPSPSPRVPPFQTKKLLTVSAPVPPKLPPFRVSPCPVQVLLKL